MTTETAQPLRDQIDAVYRAESRHVLATLIRLLGDFDLAEEGVARCLRVRGGAAGRGTALPANPRAWLISAGRFKAIDAMRRRTRLDAALAEIAEQMDTDQRRRGMERRRRSRTIGCG